MTMRRARSSAMRSASSSSWAISAPASTQVPGVMASSRIMPVASEPTVTERKRAPVADGADAGIGLTGRDGGNDDLRRPAAETAPPAFGALRGGGLEPQKVVDARPFEPGCGRGHIDSPDPDSENEGRKGQKALPEEMHVPSCLSAGTGMGPLRHT
jgi:hypothetical protein